MAVSRGQSEAAAALGLRQGRVMSLVVLPQALRVIVPPLISQYLNLTKNTTLGIAVGYLDLKGTLGGITMNQTGRELECMLLMMMIYLILSLLISSAMNVYNATTKLKER
jgi:general L-amino acid transport system permease protein